MSIKKDGATQVNMPKSPDSLSLWQTNFYLKGDQAKLKVPTILSRRGLAFLNCTANIVRPIF